MNPVKHCDEHFRFYEGRSCPDCRLSRLGDALVILIAFVSIVCIFATLARHTGVLKP